MSGATGTVCSHVVGKRSDVSRWVGCHPNRRDFGGCEPKKSRPGHTRPGTLRKMADDVRRSRSIWEIPVESQPSQLQDVLDETPSSALLSKTRVVRVAGQISRRPLWLQ